MRQVMWMVAGCVGSWLAAAVIADRATETLLGMLGPLAAAAATWLVVERTHHRAPAQVTRVLTTAFGVKMLFFGLYVVGVTRLPGIDLAAFGVAFFAYFITLYAVQAILLRGLTAPQIS